MKTFLKDATSFVGFRKRRQPQDFPDLKFPCPVCKGYGHWNLELNAYGQGQHFNALCFQCFGWGWVAKRDSKCIHNFVDYQVPPGHRSGLHYARCSKCKRETSYDTSD
jgi:hypothetical protein